MLLLLLLLLLVVVVVVLLLLLVYITTFNSRAKESLENSGCQTLITVKRTGPSGRI